MDCVRVALVNLYKASPKQAHESRFSCAFFTIYSITEIPFINCPRKLREQNRKEQNKAIFIPAGVPYSEIVLPFPFLFQLIEAFKGHSEATSLR